MLGCRLLCALAVLGACGPSSASAGTSANAGASATPAAPQAAAPQPGAEQGAASSSPGRADLPAEPVAGDWWIFLPTLPIRGFRVSIEPGRDGETRPGTWAIFDWRATTKADALQRRSKPVRITAVSDGPRLRLEGPSPMISEAGRPNGQSGRWTIELRRSAHPGESPDWSGIAVHDGGLTGADGVRAEMERTFRRWQ